MKKLGTILGTAALLATALIPLAPATAQADDNKKEMAIYWLGNHAEQARVSINSATSCLEKADELRKLGVPGSTKVEIGGDSPDKGVTTIDGAVKICKAGVAQDKIRGVELWAFQVVDTLQQVGAGDNVETLAKVTKNCHETTAALLAAGMDPSTPIKFSDQETTLGAVDAEVCAKGDVKVKQVAEKKVALYKGILKADKLDMMMKAYPYGYFIGRNNVTDSTDAKKLAAATAWFEILELSESCAKGPMYTYRKHAFNKAHKLVKSTERTYCGDPGPSAMK